MLKNRDIKGAIIRMLVFEIQSSDETSQESLRSVGEELGSPLVLSRLPLLILNQDSITKSRASQEYITKDTVPSKNKRGAVVAIISKLKARQNKSYSILKILDTNLGRCDNYFEEFCTRSSLETSFVKRTFYAHRFKGSFGRCSIDQDSIYSYFGFNA